MRKPSSALSLAENTHGSKASWEAASERLLLLTAVLSLAFFVWGALAYGRDAEDFRFFERWSAKVLLGLCAVLALNAAQQIRRVCLEGLKRQESPPPRTSPSVRTARYRIRGRLDPWIHSCLEGIEAHFHRFYASQRYDPPYVVYLYYAKKGLLSLLTLPSIKTGFLLLFLSFALSLGDHELHPWVPNELLGGAAFFLLLSVMLHFLEPYERLWLQVVEQPDQACLAIKYSVHGRSKSFDRLCRSMRPSDTHPGQVDGEMGKTRGGRRMS